MVKLDGGTVGLGTFEPGWRWSEHVKPLAGTDTCQSAHIGYCISGRMVVQMDDGTEKEVAPGDVVVIPPGHDAWVVGDEPCVQVDFTGMETYAKAKSPAPAFAPRRLGRRRGAAVAAEAFPDQPAYDDRDHGADDGREEDHPDQRDPGREEHEGDADRVAVLTMKMTSRMRASASTPTSAMRRTCCSSRSSGRFGEGPPVTAAPGRSGYPWGPARERSDMSDETVHKVHVRLTRENPPVRQAHLLCTGEVVTFGTPGWQGEHYGFAPGTAEDNPGTLDFLVASVGGCLIGTLGGALKARGIDGSGGRLTADAAGEVVVNPDGVLRLRRIDIVYHLMADEEQRAAAERAHAFHAAHCPNARSVAAAIDIVTELEPRPPGAAAAG